MDDDRIPAVVSVRWIGGHRLHVEFDTGEAGEVDFARHLRFRDLCAPLKDVAFFKQVRADRESGMLLWPNGLEFDPLVPRHFATGTPMPDGAGPIPDSEC